MFSFAYPLLFSLLLLPLLVHWWIPPYRDRQLAVRAPFFEDLVTLSGQTPASGSVVRRRSPLRTVVLVSCWMLLVSSLARPQWIEAPVVQQTPSRDLLLAVDLSASMQTEDFTTADGVKSTRLDAVKQVLDDFLARRKGDRVGLIFFGSAAFTQAPFTQDLDTVRDLMREAQVGMAGPKTAFGDAIGLAIGMFESSHVKDRLLIMLTDGNDTSSKLQPEKAAAIARDQDIVIDCVAVGDPRAAGEQKLDEKTLRAVAKIAGGHDYWAGNRKDLDEIYRRIDRMATHEIQSISHRPRRDLYHWPLLVAVLVSMLLQFGILFRGVSRR